MYRDSVELPTVKQSVILAYRVDCFFIQGENRKKCIQIWPYVKKKVSIQRFQSAPDKPCIHHSPEQIYQEVCNLCNSPFQECSLGVASGAVAHLGRPSGRFVSASDFLIATCQLPSASGAAALGPGFACGFLLVIDFFRVKQPADTCT